MKTIFIAAGVVIFIVYLLSKLKQLTPSTKHQNKIKKANQILKKISDFKYPGQVINFIRLIDPFVFEELILSSFKNNGYKIFRNARYTGDGGVDGRVKINGRLYLIQAKRYKNHINSQHLAIFETLIESTSCDGGFFVHTGRTAKTSLKKFKKSKIYIISGSLLVQLLTGSVESNHLF